MIFEFYNLSSLLKNVKMRRLLVKKSGKEDNFKRIPLYMILKENFQIQMKFFLPTHLGFSPSFFLNHFFSSISSFSFLSSSFKNSLTHFDYTIFYTFAFICFQVFFKFLLYLHFIFFISRSSRQEEFIK